MVRMTPMSFDPTTGIESNRSKSRLYSVFVAPINTLRNAFVSAVVESRARAKDGFMSVARGTLSDPVSRGGDISEDGPVLCKVSSPYKDTHVQFTRHVQILLGSSQGTAGSA